MPAAFSASLASAPIYRRALLIAPWVDPFGSLNPNDTRPGVVRIVSAGNLSAYHCRQGPLGTGRFQDRFDLSVRLEWDALALDGAGQWKIVANTLADLTNRENRFGHYAISIRAAIAATPTPLPRPEPIQRQRELEILVEPDLTPAPSGNAIAKANMLPDSATSGQIHVATYSVSASSYDPSSGPRYPARPLAYVDATSATIDATANVMLNDEGQVVRVVQGPVPLWGARRGQDVMLTDVLAFDLRVYDPGAPLYHQSSTNVVLEPSDPGWKTYYNTAIGSVSGPAAGATFAGQGAYVDLGYGYGFNATTPPTVAPGATWIVPWFATARGIYHVPTDTALAPGYAVYDTWSTSYENNGIDDDGVFGVDQGTNGLDDPGTYLDPATNLLTSGVVRSGADDIGERETAPPYDVPLRGIQVLLRVYERDSRQIRQVRVNQHFLDE